MAVVAVVVVVVVVVAVVVVPPPWMPTWSHWMEETDVDGSPPGVCARIRWMRAQTAASVAGRTTVGDRVSGLKGRPLWLLWVWSEAASVIVHAARRE